MVCGGQKCLNFFFTFQMGSTGRTVELEEEPSRDNGWSCPPHPLQIIAWVTVIVLAILHNTCLVPALPTSWQPAGYIVSLEIKKFKVVSWSEI